jgi:hypothetical protein
MNGTSPRTSDTRFSMLDTRLDFRTTDCADYAEKIATKSFDPAHDGRHKKHKGNHRFRRFTQILFTAENAKDAREVSASLVYSAKFAFKASFVATFRLRPQGRRIGLISKLAEIGYANGTCLHSH